MLSLVISYHQLTSKCYQGNLVQFCRTKNRRFSEMTFISHFRSSSLPYNLHWLPAGIVPTPFILCYSSISVSYVYGFLCYIHSQSRYTLELILLCRYGGLSQYSPYSNNIYILLYICLLLVILN